MVIQEQMFLRDIEIIEYLGNMHYLSSEGHNDLEGYQIFTPDFIVNDMIKMVGLKNIIDLDKTILEPTSGDGAFTVRILEMRLKNLKMDSKILFHAVKSLSTIYSIEMDRDLLIRQRNNLYTIIINFAKAINQVITDELNGLIKRIIVTNIIWGETNIREEHSKSNIIGWFLPIPTMKDKKHRDTPNYAKADEIRFAKWMINEDYSYIVEFETPEFDNSIDETQIGGLFDEW